MSTEGLGRGKCDYRRYKIKPQRGMAWPKAVQFMLQSSDNVVIGTPVKLLYWQKEPWVYHFRIKDGVIQYKPRDECPWSNAAGHEFSEVKKFDAIAAHCLDKEDDMEKRIEYLEQEVERLKRGRRK